MAKKDIKVQKLFSPLKIKIIKAKGTGITQKAKYLFAKFVPLK